MSKPRLITAISLALFLRWLATGHVTVTVAWATVTIPVLAIAAAAVIAASAAVALLVAYRIRADRAALAAWRAGQGGPCDDGR